jgi:hypothetical protein
VTTAADAEQLALWRIIHDDDRWIDNTIKGGWYVEVQPSAHGRLLQGRLSAFLRRLEHAGIKELRPLAQSAPAAAVNEGRALQILRAQQLDTSYSMAVVDPDERTATAGITNTARTIASAFRRC